MKPLENILTLLIYSGIFMLGYALMMGFVMSISVPTNSPEEKEYKENRQRELYVESQHVKRFPHLYKKQRAFADKYFKK